MLSGLSEFPTDHFFFQFSFFENIGNMTTKSSTAFIEHCAIFDNMANRKSKINIDNVLENAPTQLKTSVQVNDADSKNIQELFAKERQCMTAQVQVHIRKVIPCLLMNGIKYVNVTRNMRTITLVTTPSGSFGSSSSLASLVFAVSLL